MGAQLLLSAATGTRKPQRHGTGVGKATTDSPLTTHSLTHSLTHHSPPTHSLTHYSPLTTHHSPTHPPNQPTTYPLTTHSFTHSLTHHPLTHPPTDHSPTTHPIYTHHSRPTQEFYFIEYFRRTYGRRCMWEYGHNCSGE